MQSSYSPKWFSEEPEQLNYRKSMYSCQVCSWLKRKPSQVTQLWLPVQGGKCTPTREGTPPSSYKWTHTHTRLPSLSPLPAGVLVSAHHSPFPLESFLPGDRRQKPASPNSSQWSPIKEAGEKRDTNISLQVLFASFSPPFQNFFTDTLCPSRCKTLLKSGSDSSYLHAEFACSFLWNQWTSARQEVRMTQGALWNWEWAAAGLGVGWGGRHLG